MAPCKNIVISKILLSSDAEQLYATKIPKRKEGLLRAYAPLQIIFARNQTLTGKGVDKQ
jgi:hypothetical protein